MRTAILLALAAASCATPATTPPDAPSAATGGLAARRASAADRLATLRWRSTWPSAADRDRWEALHLRAEHAEVVAASGAPDDVRAFCEAVDSLDQMDALFRVGESARRPR